MNTEEQLNEEQGICPHERKGSAKNKNIQTETAEHSPAKGMKGKGLGKRRREGIRGEEERREEKRCVFEYISLTDIPQQKIFFEENQILIVFNLVYRHSQAPKNNPPHTFFDFIFSGPTTIDP